MALGIMKSSRGIADLLSKAHNPAPEGKVVYYFKGDLNQMAKATEVAKLLGIKTAVAGGIPYVTSEEDYFSIISYMKIYKVDGYWNYE